MNVLFLSHRIPYPPDKGDKIRSFHWVRHLGARHRVHLACLADDSRDLAHVPALERLCASVDVVYRPRRAVKWRAGLALLSSTRSLTVESCASSVLRERVRRRLESGQLEGIVAFSSGMAEYVREVAGIPKVLDLVDVDSEKWLEYGRHAPFPRSRVYREEGNRLRRYEAALAAQFDHCVLVSEPEARLYASIAPAARTVVIPNGVDLEYFDGRRAAGAGSGPPTIVFTGAMDYFANEDGVVYFCKHVLPLVAAVCPAVRFWIVGRNPTDAVRRLARDPHVVVTGGVPDVRPYLAAATVAVAPLRIARGVQNKILEALAMGVPVVATSRGFEGLGVTRDEDLLVRDDPADFAEAVLALIRDPGLRGALSVRGRQAVAQAHSWPRSVARLEALLAQAVGAGRGVPGSRPEVAALAAHGQGAGA